MASIKQPISSGSISDAIADHTPPVVVRVIKAVRSSFLLFVTLVGVISLLIGIYLNEGVLAGMFGVWGISAIVAAAISYVLLSLLQ